MSYKTLFQSAGVGAFASESPHWLLDSLRKLAQIVRQRVVTHKRIVAEVVSMSSSLPADHILAEIYAKVAIPSDQLVADPSKLARFIAELPLDHQAVDACILSSRILLLRKSGKLPRVGRVPR